MPGVPSLLGAGSVNTAVTLYWVCVAAYIKRVIAHPNFRNIGYKECEKAMADMDLGDVIIRPSSKVGSSWWPVSRAA